MRQNFVRYLPHLVVVFLRLVTPFFIWQNVFWVTAAAVFLDAIDSETFRFATRSQLTRLYQNTDKAMDFYWYVFALAYAWGSPFFGLLLAFWLWRLVGMAFFYLARKREVFFFCPNLFEHLFIVYVLTLTFPSLTWLVSASFLPLTLLIIIFLKMIQEYIVHLRQFSFHDYFFKQKFT